MELDHEHWPWMHTPNTSARRKFGHALSLAYPLIEDVGRYEDSKPYVFHASLGFTSDDATRFEIEAEERRAPDEDWALRAGDVIQNFRASLDHAVWAATPEDKRTRWTQFPICDRPRDFKRLSSKENERNWCAWVSDEVLAAIARAQPYERSKGRDERKWEPLLRLRELSNEDKHRTLATVAVGVGGDPCDLGTGGRGLLHKADARASARSRQDTRRHHRRERGRDREIRHPILRRQGLTWRRGDRGPRGHRARGVPSALGVRVREADAVVDSSLAHLAFGFSMNTLHVACMPHAPPAAASG